MRFWKNEKGFATEYALILAIVALGIIIAAVAFKDELAAIFTRSATELAGAPPGP